MKFRKLRLNRDGLGDHHFARDVFYPSYLFVSDETKVLFESAGWRGYAFGRPEDIGP